MTFASRLPLRRPPLARLHWLCLALLLVSGTLTLGRFFPAGQNELIALRSAWGWADIALGPVSVPDALQGIPHAAIPLWVQLPATAALALGRLAQMDWVWLLTAARAAGFCCSTLLCTLAVKAAPTGKKLLMVCCLLPCTITLMTTANTLRPAFGLALLFFALVLAIAQSPVHLPAGRWLELQLTGLALVLAAPICLPLLGLVLLIPRRRLTGRVMDSPLNKPAPARQVFAAIGRWLLLLTALAALCAAAWLLLRQYGNQAADLRLDMLFSSSVVSSSVLHEPLFSARPTLVWQQVVQPLQWLQSLLWAFLLAAALPATAFTLRPTRRQRWTALLCCMLTAALWYLTAVYDLAVFAWQPLCLLAAPAAWALTPCNIQLRREKPLPFAAACLAATALGHLQLFGIIGMM